MNHSKSQSKPSPTSDPPTYAEERAARRRLATSQQQQQEQFSPESPPLEDDNVSALSGSNNSITSKRSVWSAAALILRGINPDTIPEDEELVGRNVAAVSNEEAEFDLSTNHFDDDQDAPYQIREHNKRLPPSESPYRQSKADKRRMQSPLSDNGLGIIPNNSSSIDFMLDGIDFILDDPRTMTRGRRLAMFLMQRYAWYNPRLSKSDDTATPSEPEDATEHPRDSMHPILLASMKKKNKGKSFLSLAEAMAANVVAGDISDQRLLEAYPFTHSRRERPSLKKAWAYFDHVALSRYVIPPEKLDAPDAKKKCCLTRIYRKLFCKRLKQLQRAEPGERELPTALYEPIFTPHAQLGDFGLGIGLYFSTLRAITVLTLLAGLLNIPNFYYYASAEYTPGLSNFNSYSNISVTSMLKGSAICTDVSWVLCVDCQNLTDEENRRYFAASRQDTRVGIGERLDGTVPDMKFYLRNNCPSPSIQTSMINYGTILLMIIGTIVLNMYLQRMEVAFDEDEQTPQDYSVIIMNPPGDATDPKEWHDFFRDAFDAHVTACTVAVDNDLLVRSLVERRERLRQIEMMLEPGTSLDTLTLAGLAAKKERERRLLGQLLAQVSPGMPEHFARLSVLTAKVQGLAQQDYPATNIFITFETEKAQRDVLAAYNLGSLDVKRNNTSAVDELHLFRGTHVLKLGEPDEPNTIRWQDLNVKAKEKMKQMFFTFLATAAAIVSIAALVFTLSSQSVLFTSFAIAIFNTIFPMFAKVLTDLEAHSSEGNKQCSLYFKIAAFRWVNTAIVITLITPFTSTLTEGVLVNQIYSLFIAEIITSNAILVLDPMGHINRHYLAPRETTQDAMNLRMQGAVFELAERYTNMTKILFLALWYCTIFPGALFMCSLALFVNYFADRFALMRTWKRPPQLGTKISEFSRRYFFSLAILAMAVQASYYWAGFPFDNLCPVEENERPDDWYVGDWKVTHTTENVTSRNGTIALTQTNHTITIPANEDVYKLCQQDFFRFRAEDRKFPFLSQFQIEGQEWMTADQEIVTDIFGWTAVGVLAVICLSFLYSAYSSVMRLFRGTYDSCGDDQGINFSDVPSINSYVPEVKSAVFSYPLLACNIDRIDKNLLEWTDPDRPHVFYDLTKDAEILLRGTDVSSNIVFTQIAHWPPPGKEKTQ